MHGKFKKFVKGSKKVLRRFSVFLVCFFFAASLFLSPAASLPPARASSAASAEASLEVLALLYSLLSTAGTASGMKEGLSDYEKGEDLMDAFIDFCFLSTAGVAPPSSRAFTVELEDGSSVEVTFEDLKSVSSAVLKPDAGVDTDAAGEYVRMLFVAGLIAGGGQAPEPDQEPEDPFTKIQKFSISAGMSLKVAEFFDKLQKGEIEGIEPEEYYGTWFDGTYERDAEGNYVLNGSIIGLNTYFGVPYVYYFDGTAPFRPALYLDGGKLFLAAYDEAGGVLFSRPRPGYPPELNSFRYHYSVSANGSGESGEGLVSSFLFDGCKYASYSFNIPVFSSYEDAAAFFQGGDAAAPSVITNLQPYDFPGLAASLLNVLAPVLNADAGLTPKQMLDVNAAVSEAVQALPQPEPGSSPQENAAVYEQAVTEAVTETLPEPSPDPDPDSPPSAQEAVKKYRRDLTMIFPFCIPFDLIRFFRAMNAEPVAPCFHIPFVVEPLDINMDVELDMSFLEPAMEVFRLGELGLFIIGLILVTRKVIKW